LLQQANIIFDLNLGGIVALRGCQNNYQFITVTILT